MSDILLVHGSCHNAWCWSLLAPQLSSLGHSVRAIDLPGMGADNTPLAAVTLDSYAEAILAATRGPTVLVGHSAGGYAITAAASRAPERISHLTYICAYVPIIGKSLADMRRMASRQPLIDAIVRGADGLTFTIDPAKAVAKFYADVAPEVAADAIARLEPQPILPQDTPFTGPLPTAVPRSYVRCELDGAIPYEFQQTMTEDWPEGTVVDMATSHSPFLSQPEALARHLDRMIRTGHSHLAS